MLPKAFVVHLSHPATEVKKVRVQETTRRKKVCKIETSNIHLLDYGEQFVTEICAQVWRQSKFGDKARRAFCLAKKALRSYIFVQKIRQ